MPADFAPFGLAVGHATDPDGATGLTVVRGIDGPFHATAVVLGRAAGTREIHTATPAHLVDRVDALLLTGGSAYGLDAAAGVMRWMEERGRGFRAGPGVVPIVPAAVVFDLAPLGHFAARPSANMAYTACDVASPREIAEGSVGAGTGVTVGKVAGLDRAMKGGVGCAVLDAGALVIGALAVVNALGDVRDQDGRIIAGARAADGTFIDSQRTLARGGSTGDPPFGSGGMQNTTLAVVATTARLTRPALAQLAAASAAALYQRITPSGTTLDGDVIFAVCPVAGEFLPSLQVEALAVSTLALAIERSVRQARGRDGIPGLADAAASHAPGDSHAGI